ncbi:MerR family transcriptional regulator [Saccharothrix sp. NPDC042600]|uniref:MerR family transcriptional regulator n=1 Tax=Saccharothrix TaxID=2071 RepID=UPI00340DB035|nr:MerR family transcriptional regulator [Saccharothrix mutabilis subsp. capreolus]
MSDLVPIGVFAEAARVTVKALRHYHALGVVVPARVDPATNYRYYRWDQLGDVLCVTTLRDLGTPLDRIKEHLVGGTPLHDVLAAERVRLRRQVARAERALALVDALRDAPRLPDVRPDVVELPDRDTVALTGPAHADTTGQDAAELIGRLLATPGVDAGAPVIGEYPLKLAHSFTIRVRLEVAGPVAGLRVEPWPGGRFARVVHVGPLDALPIAYHGLVRWLHEHRHHPAGPVYERYLDDPATTPAHLLRTEVLHRVP